MARPRAIAPRIRPAYARNATSLKVKVYLVQQRNKYCTRNMEPNLPITMMKNSIPIKLKDQSVSA